MFDIGFWELFLIFMLLLFVVGPERLPTIAGYLGKWFGKFQRYFFELKDSIQQEAEEPTKKISEKLAFLTNKNNALNLFMKSAEANSMREWAQEN